MRGRPFAWLLLSLLFFAGAAYFWRFGERLAAQRQAARATNATSSVTSKEKLSRTNPAAPVLMRTQPGTLNAPQAAAWANPNPDARLAHRLTNTGKTPGELARSDQAILLENALLDTAQSVTLAIPAHLRAQGDAGAYIVQSRNPTDGDFRALLTRLGGTIVSYIPNNAYLVRASQEMATELAASPQILAVLPLEPYFKLKPSLLALAIEQRPLPENTLLNLLVFGGTEEATEKALQNMGVELVGRDRSPFGTVWKVKPPVQSLPALAGLPGVQAVEFAPRRVRANDLSRERLKTASDSVTPNNYLGLTGSNVLVNVNDTGVDKSHPDLAGRVTGDFLGSLSDLDGHGTHVAGIIASSGGKSLTVTNASGSVMPPVAGQFRGMAPGARLFSIGTDLAVWPFRIDGYLQESAALTNALISNNSWHYYGDTEYDLAAASYDAAVRDSLPGVSGSQPVLYVFSAGNSGGGSENGTSGNPDTLFSPGTAKNVITVGATEIPRAITNEVRKCATVDYGTNVVEVCATNQFWFLSTDDERQVAFFSGRGNVGIGIEGDFGRFKPDVVAPGTFVVSTRSQQWDQGNYYNPTSHQYYAYTDLLLGTNQVFNNTIFVPGNAVQVIITIEPNFASPIPFPDLLVYVKQSDFPTTNTGGYDFVRTNEVSMPPDGGANLTPRGVDWHYAIVNPTTQAVTFNVFTDVMVTNELGNYFEVLSNLNNQLGPYYRYESGTSMAAAEVSGTLALMQEFFQQRLGRTNSPALMKALLINGARSAGNLYNLGVNNAINFQGWGLVNLPNSVPGILTNQSATSTSMKFFDQSPAAALATSQRHTYRVSVSEAAQAQPVRATLVWTDPPGNPLAGTKLVNDLDLVVTNLDNGDVFFGNDILTGNDFSLPWDTNGPPVIDVVNNVENVYLSPFLGSNYTVTVIGRRVNVNAVTTHPNNVVQDYALVISSGDGQNSDALTVTDTPTVARTTPLVTYLAHTFQSLDPGEGVVGGMLLNQRVGANTPLLGTGTVPFPGSPSGRITIGVTNQWHFYVFTNNTSFTNVAFVTFLPTTLSVPRMGVYDDLPENATRGEADLDMYVSRDPGLTNLESSVIIGADKALGRDGTEVIIYTNATPGEYYIGIKSEDREAAEYGFLGVASEAPFGDTDGKGNQLLRGFPPHALVPDGSPDAPGRVLVTALPKPMKVRRTIVTNIISHELMGDLVGTLSDLTHARAGSYSVLNNHSPENTVLNKFYVYDDSDQGGLPNSQHSDGPGSLENFAGKKAGPVWQLNMVDNAHTHLGTNEHLRIFLEKQQELTDGLSVSIPVGGCLNEYIEVPVEATNLTIAANITGGTGPVSLEVCPMGASGSDCKRALVTGTATNTVTIDKRSSPPLNAGFYRVRLCNQGPDAVTVYVIARLGLDLNAIVPIKFTSAGPIPITDDAVTYSSIAVPLARKIVSVEAGLRVDHPRVSDLVFHLISPSGTRVLLCENRGGLTTNGMGSLVTNLDTVTTTFPDFSSGLGKLSLNGYAAVVSNSILRVSPKLDSVSGTAWLWDKQKCDTGFDTHFRFRIWDLGNRPGVPIGADGFTFTVQNASPTSPDWRSDPGGRYASVFYNTFWNWPGCTDYTVCDLSDNSMGILNNDLYQTQIDLNPVGINLSDGLVHEAKINYDGSLMTARLDNLPLLVNVPMPGLRPGLDASGYGWVGFTAGSGWAWENHDILDWTFTAIAPATNIDYLVFTEDTNLTATPIKFAAPPFLRTNTLTTNLLFSGFETAAVADYRAPSVVDGWTLSTGRVSVIDDPNLAHTGTRLLALANGQIGRTLPTKIGKRYGLSFLSRGPGIVGMWRGESNATDSVAALNGTPENITYTPGIAGQAFVCSPRVNPRISIPDQPVFKLTNSLSIEGWIRPRGLPGIVLWRGDRRGGMDPYHLQVNGNGRVGFYIDSATAQASVDAPMALNQWYHVAGTLDGNTGLMRIFLNGVLANQALTGIRPLGDLDPTLEPTVGIGNVGEHQFNYPFIGEIDEISLYGRALSGSEINAIYAAGSAGKFDPAAAIPAALAKAQVTVAGASTRVIFGDNTNWRSNFVSFTATQNGTAMQIDGLEPGMLLDSFSMSESDPGLYYFPEESLEALKGEWADGQWYLEVLDNRAGAAIPAPQLVSWQLKFILEDNVPWPTAITHGLSVTNSVEPGEVVYYAVDMPSWASYATNILLHASGPVNLLFNQYYPPTGTNGNDVVLLAGSTGGIGAPILSENSTPRLVPGSRYYLGIQNAGTLGSVTAALEVDANVTPLTNGVSLISTLAPGTMPRYFSYDASSNANALSFQLLNATKDLTLVARKGVPLPTPADCDFLSRNPGLDWEEILILTNSGGAALSPGRWYVGVFAEGTEPADYTIVATEYTAFPSLVTLSAGVAFQNTNTGPANAADFYRFIMSPSAVRAQFEIRGATTEMTLVARKGLPLPTLSSFDYQSANPGTTDELIVVFKSSQPVALAPGEWFLEAIKTSASPGVYSIKASEFSAEGTNITILNYAVESNRFCLTWDSLPGLEYYVQGKSDLGSKNWDTLSPAILATEQLTRYCQALPTPYHFFRIRQALTGDSGVPRPGISSIRRDSGDVILSWTAPAGNQFKVQWSPSIKPGLWNDFTNVITSTDGSFSFRDDGAQSGGLGVARFYRLELKP